MIGTLEYDKDAVTSPKSDYKPSDDVRDFTAYVQKDYENGHNILTKTWNELNDSSVLDDMDRGRRMMNAFVDETVENPNEAWKYRGTRSMARNKGIAMHANLTAAYSIPSFDAQNEDDEIDRGFSEFMTELVEWMAEDVNSDYKSSFLSLISAAESDPIVYLGAEWQEIPQTIRVRQEEGRYGTKEILDEVLSGFKAPIYTAEQIILSNAFERNIQKHRCIGKRRWIEYSEAEAKYGMHENFQFVAPGRKTVFNAADETFYDLFDDEHPNLVEEYTPAYRRDDVEVCFLGGIYMGHPEVDQNPVKHRDNFGAPRYDIQDFGFYPIGSHFIFRKSMMAAMRWDNDLYDAATEIIANRAILEVEFPVAVSGTDKIDEEIVYPNAVIALQDKDARVQKVLPEANFGPLRETLADTRQSLEDGSIPETLSGQLPPASQKAYTVAQTQANARKIISGVAKGIALSVSRYGLLMADIAVNQLSIPQIDEVVGSSMKLKYRKFTLAGKEVGGKNMAVELLFDEALIGDEMTDEEKDEYNLTLLEKSGYPEQKKSIMVANPELFAKMKYLARADYREMFPRDDETFAALIQGLKAQFSQDPYVDQEALTREVFHAVFKSKGDRFITKNPVLAPGTVPGQPARPGQPNVSTTQPVPGVRG